MSLFKLAPFGRPFSELSGAAFAGRAGAGPGLFCQAISWLQRAQSSSPFGTKTVRANTSTPILEQEDDSPQSYRPSGTEELIA
jgi:hypothetical protein